MEKKGTSPVVSALDDDMYPNKSMYEPNYMGIDLMWNNIIISG